jgi:protein ImuB
VRGGDAATTAAARAPAVRQRARDPAAELAAVARLTLVMGQFTPNLVPQADGVLLEIAGSLRLFGGVRALQRRVRGASLACGLTPRLGLAPTPRGAWWLATCAAGPRRCLRPASLARRLQGLPLSPVLRREDLPSRLDELFEALGCHTLGDVRRLPRPGLQRRGAAALLARLDQAWGERPDPRRWAELPERFEARLELAWRSDDAAHLARAAEGLVQALAGWLSLRWLALREAALDLHHERRHDQPGHTRLPLSLRQPSRDAARIQALLQEHLQRLALPAPVYHLELHLLQAEPWAGEATGWLPDTTQAAQDVDRLLDRLAARLGPRQVCRLLPRDDHRPESAQGWVPATATAATPATGLPAPDGAAPDVLPLPAHVVPRPLWLLEPPRPLSERQGRPCLDGETLVLLGPAERLEGGWFDDAPACRDYHLATAADHALRWVFHLRRPGQDATGRPLAPGWYLHGLFG